MKRRLKPPQRKFEAASLLSSRVSSQSSQALPKRPSGSSRMKAVRAGEPEILLPRSHPSAASAASARLAGGRLEGAALPRDPLDSGSAGRCQLLQPLLPWSRWIAAAWAPATHISLAEPRARWGEGGTRRGRDSKAYSPAGARPTQACPVLLASANQWRGGCRLLCKSAEAWAFIEKSTKLAPPSLHRSLLSFPPPPDSLPYFSAVWTGACFR